MRTNAEKALEYINLFKGDQKGGRTLDWGWIALAEQCLKEEIARPEAGEFKWALVPKDVPLGAFPACSPGTPMYAIDERDVPLNTPFRVWKIDMPPLPPLPQRDER